MVNLLKYGLLIAFVLGLFVNSYAQNDSELLIPYRNGKKWGYMNTRGELVIKTKYQEAYPFNNGLARVKKKNKFGFINKLGELIADFELDEAYDFYYGLALVTNEDSTYVLDTVGQRHKFVAHCGGSIMHMLNYNVFQDNGLKGIARSYPYELLIQPKYYDAKVFSDIIIFAVMDSTRKWGVISENDSIIQPFIYDRIEAVYNGYNVYLETEKDGGKGAIDRFGELMAEPNYSNIKWYNELYFTTLENGKTGFIYKCKEYWKH